MAINPGKKNPPLGKKNPTNREFEGMLELFEKALRDLEVDYEKYFNGTERRPPIHQRRQIGHMSREIDQAFITNTALKFRARQLQNRLTTLQNYWNRIMRQIEEGTYIRDKRKAAQRQREAEEQRARDREAAQPVYEISQDLGSFSFDDLAAELAATFDAIQTKSPSSSTSAPASGFQSVPGQGFGAAPGGYASSSVPPSTLPPSSPPPRPSHSQQGSRPAPVSQQNQPPRVQPGPAASAPNDDPEARAIYERYLAARRQCNQSTDISFDRLKQSMQSQRSSLRETKGVQNVDFDVVIRNGQAFLKPTSKD